MEYTDSEISHKKYIVVDADQWDSFRSVMGYRGLDVEYSEEYPDTGIEFHVYNYLDEAADILTAITWLTDKSQR